jgi:RNA polymerase sigma-70 factor (ECF subfamily)
MDEWTHHALAARDGDRAALARFVRLSQPDVWRLCAHLVSPAEADDLTQEVYARALGALHRLQAQHGVRPWLFGIARHVCVDTLRKSSRRRSIAERYLRPAEPDAGGAGAVELAQLLDALDPDRRAAFVLTQVLGLSYDEAAATCGVPVGTIRSRVSRARLQLADALESGTAGAAGAAHG